MCLSFLPLCGCLTGISGLLAKCCVAGAAQLCSCSASCAWLVRGLLVSLLPVASLCRFFLSPFSPYCGQLGACECGKLFVNCEGRRRGGEVSPLLHVSAVAVRKFFIHLFLYLSLHIAVSWVHQNVDNFLSSARPRRVVRDVFSLSLSWPSCVNRFFIHLSPSISLSILRSVGCTKMWITFCRLQGRRVRVRFIAFDADDVAKSTLMTFAAAAL